MRETRDLGIQEPQWHTLLFEEQVAGDMRVVCPQDVKNIRNNSELGWSVGRDVRPSTSVRKRRSGALAEIPQRFKPSGRGPEYLQDKKPRRGPKYLFRTVNSEGDLCDEGRKMVRQGRPQKDDCGRNGGMKTRRKEETWERGGKKKAKENKSKEREGHEATTVGVGGGGA